MRDVYFEGPVNPGELPRLLQQHETIRDLMLDGRWRTLGEIAEKTDYPEASISAQLRHLRKPRFGKFRVEKQRRNGISSGLWEYRVSAAEEIKEQYETALVYQQ